MVNIKILNGFRNKISSFPFPNNVTKVHNLFTFHPNVSHLLHMLQDWWIEKYPMSLWTSSNAILFLFHESYFYLLFWSNMVNPNPQLPPHGIKAIIIILWQLLHNIVTVAMNNEYIKTRLKSRKAEEGKTVLKPWKKGFDHLDKCWWST